MPDFVILKPLRCCLTKRQKKISLKMYPTWREIAQKKPIGACISIQICSTYQHLHEHSRTSQMANLNEGILLIFSDLRPLFTSILFSYTSLLSEIDRFFSASVLNVVYYTHAAHKAIFQQACLNWFTGYLYSFAVLLGTSSLSLHSLFTTGILYFNVQCSAGDV